ncbi:MAG: crossover junction endodeoxyribonuclease RuvC [Actinobacteria bacterium]|nr:crossover junction endodeoxyribonuclease RuvC [Actinomycetota bacterium]
MRVLGVDPGIATTGFAVLDRGGSAPVPVAIGTLRTAARLPHAQRLADLAGGFREVIAEHRPEVVAAERVFFSVNVRTAMAVGQASGVILAAAAAAGIPVFDYTPTEVKLSVAGVGTAPKQQVASMVAALLRLDAPPQPADAADACALAICHLNRSGLARALAAQGASG